MRWPCGSPRLTSMPLRTMNGLRTRGLESIAGTSTCQPERSFPLKRLFGARLCDVAVANGSASAATDARRSREVMVTFSPRFDLVTHQRQPSAPDLAEQPHPVCADDLLNASLRVLSRQ